MTCNKCKHWVEFPKESLEDNLGRCKKLSAPEDEDYPDIEETGLDGYPLCWHDGGISTVDTKGWFSCFHFDLKWGELPPKNPAPATQRYTT